MIKEEIKNIDASSAAVKKFAFAISGILAAISALLFYFGYSPTAIYLITFGGALLLLFFFTPEVLKWVYIGWMSLAIILGWVMTKIILTIFYFILVTSIGIIAKLTTKNFLDLNRGKGDPTYWNKRSDSVKDKNYYERQY